MPKRAEYDDPKCTHGGTEEDTHRVSNQPDTFDADRPLRSVWVCARRACLYDALAWVERGTGEQAFIRPRKGHSCELCATPEGTTP